MNSQNFGVNHPPLLLSHVIKRTPCSKILLEYREVSTPLWHHVCLNSPSHIARYTKAFRKLKKSSQYKIIVTKPWKLPSLWYSYTLISVSYAFHNDYQFSVFSIQPWAQWSLCQRLSSSNSIQFIVNNYNFFWFQLITHQSFMYLTIIMENIFEEYLTGIF